MNYSQRNCSGSLTNAACFRYLEIAFSLKNPQLNTSKSYLLLILSVDSDTPCDAVTG
jgi:hypothetical protein